jgi:hypothetical protein
VSLSCNLEALGMQYLFFLCLHDDAA